MTPLFTRRADRDAVLGSAQERLIDAVDAFYCLPEPTAPGYARALLDVMRYGEASAQLQAIVKDKPDYAPAWLVLGSLQLQDNQLAQAQTSLERYVALSQAASAKTEEDEPDRGLAQAYLSLAQIAEKRKDFALAGAWLDKIDNAQSLAASLMGKPP